MLQWCVSKDPEFPRSGVTFLNVIGWPQWGALELIEFNFWYNKDSRAIRITVAAKQIRRMMSRRHKGRLRFNMEPVAPLMLRSGPIDLIH